MKLTESQNVTINRIAKALHGWVSDDIRNSYYINEFDCVEVCEGKCIQLRFHVKSDRWYNDDMYGAFIIGRRGGMLKFSNFTEHCIGEYSGAKAVERMKSFIRIYAPMCEVNFS
jgi:hypothetical protein